MNRNKINSTKSRIFIFFCLFGMTSISFYLAGQTIWEEKRRIKEVMRTSDQDVLVEFAKYDPSANVRGEAVRKISNPAVLEDIALNDTDTWVCIYAVRLIDDENVLFNIAKNAVCGDAQGHAAKKIINQGMLLEIINTRKNRDAREGAMENLSDQNKIVELARENSGVQTLAIEKIADEKILEKILMGIIEDTSKNIRWHVLVNEDAFFKITDRSFWTRIALSDKDDNVRRITVRRGITDLALLAEIARTDKSDSVREAAEKSLRQGQMTPEERLQLVKNSNDSEIEAVLKWIDDPEILFDIALNAKKANVRTDAVKKINNQKDLIELANKSSSVGRDAYKKITDPAALLEIALNSDNNDIGVTAIKRFGDAAFLEKMLRTNPNGSTRYAAMERIKDMDLIKNVALNDTQDSVRWLAIRKLSDGEQTLLIKLAKNDPDRDVRVEAIMKIKDESVLKEVIETDKDPFVRDMAMLKLSDQAVLAKIAMSSSDNDSRFIATLMLRDQNALAETLISSKDSLLKDVAIQKLIDNEALLKVVNSQSGKYRYKALRRISDQNVLMDFAQNSTDWMTRACAIGALTDLGKKRELAENDPEKEVQKTVVELPILIRGTLKGENGKALKRKTLYLMPLRNGPVYSVVGGKSELVCEETDTDYFGDYEFEIKSQWRYLKNDYELALGVKVDRDTISRLSTKEGALITFKIEDLTKNINLGTFVLLDAKDATFKLRQ